MVSERVSDDQTGHNLCEKCLHVESDTNKPVSRFSITKLGKHISQASACKMMEN